MEFIVLNSKHTDYEKVYVDLLAFGILRVEAESLRHLSAKYSSLVPPPRSTIAAAFSSDGNTIASTHGDHTVKIIDCQTGNCLKVLSGHRRTPWVVGAHIVRFHPLHPEKLASGSLDHEVRLWNTETADCIGSHDFYRPIASIAFHAQGELLAVASGHKVNDLDSPDSPLTLATSSSYLHYAPPAVLFANLNSDLRQHQMDKLPLIPSPYFFGPTFVKDDGRTLQHAGGTRNSASGQPKTEPSILSSQRQIPDAANQYDNLVAPMDISPGEPSDMNFMTNNRVSTMTGMEKASESVETNEGQSAPEFQARSSTGISERSDASGNVSLTASAQIHERSDASGNVSLTTPQESGIVERVPIGLGFGVPPIISTSASNDGNPILIPSHDPPCWELPLLQGWLMGQTHSMHTRSINGGLEGNSGMIHGTGSNSLTSELQYSHNAERLMASSMANLAAHSRVTARSGSRLRSHSRLVASTGVSQVSLPHNSQTDDAEPHRGPSGIGSEVPTSLAATAAVELPCTVKLRIWPYDIQDPCAPLELETCLPSPFKSISLLLVFSQVYRVSDMELVRVLPSMEDEVNVACFHPSVGGGLVYGTKVKCNFLGAFLRNLHHQFELYIMF
ncbi:hypothetical protein GW17_00006110 [Ensete ventricosum]|nr:hypothetical protein GW17_00006110 [Ensete ventricosum]